jgi:ribosomal protein L37AE/L43A
MSINGHDLARLERESICEACGNKTHETGRDVEGTWMCATCADMTEYGEVGQ